MRCYRTNRLGNEMYQVRTTRAAFTADLRNKNAGLLANVRGTDSGQTRAHSKSTSQECLASVMLRHLPARPR